MISISVVVQGKYEDNELLVYRYLTSTMQLNIAAACGVMANIYHESRFNPRAEGDKVGESYTSYGLCQWHKSRKTNLVNYCAKMKLDYTSVKGQMSFLSYELSNNYKSLLNILRSVPNNADGTYQAAAQMCARFEVPHGYGEWVAGTLILGPTSIDRGNFAKNNYWPIYSTGAPLPAGVNYPTNYGSKIVEIARSNLNKPHKSGAYGPDSFSSPGFIYYCYHEAGYNIEKLSSFAYYDKYSKISRSITPSEVRAGDILFYDITPASLLNALDVPTPSEYQMAIATGEGGRIYSSKIEGKVNEVSNSIGNPKYILRILSDSETNPNYNYSGGYSEAVEDFTSLTVRDEYTENIEKNLSRVEAEGFDYGYLIDLTHRGGEFRFYIPEFSESAGASWESVNIIGRSVTIKAYNSTESRSINISLDLYAGAGLYDNPNSNDIVGDLHRDVNFVKSLEYPDYSNAVVRPPSTVQLILGSAIQLVGVVSDVVVEHMKPLDSQNRSMYIKLSFTVTQTAVNPPDYSDIRDGRYVLTSTSNVSSISQNNDTNVPKFTE